MARSGHWGGKIDSGGSIPGHCTTEILVYISVIPARNSHYLFSISHASTSSVPHMTELMRTTEADTEPPVTALEGEP